LAECVGNRVEVSSQASRAALLVAIGPLSPVIFSVAAFSQTEQERSAKKLYP
jgi:hypothetical protein